MAFGVSYEAIRTDWLLFTKNFSWAALFKISAYKIILPIITGYLLVSLFFGFIAYLLVIVVIKSRKKNTGNKSNI
jgi:hypothetical protein